MFEINNSFNLDKLKASADVIRETSDTEVYLGFCLKDTADTSESRWSILQIKTTGAVYPKVTTFKWANGQCIYNLVFDDYDTYSYLFKTF